MKKIVSVVLILSVTLSLIFTLPVSASEEISVIINGTKIHFDVQPSTINGRTMVPMRAIFEALGATVHWNDETQTVTSVKDDTNISLTIDSEIMKVNDNSVVLDSPACIIDGRTLVPVRAIAEALKCIVDWNNDTSTVNIKTEGYVAPVEPAAPVYEDISANIVQIQDFINKGMYLEAMQECQNAKNWHTISPEDVKIIDNLYHTAKSKYDAYVEANRPSLTFLTEPCGYFTENSVNGIDLTWGARNTSGKIINYYTVNFTYINPVGDLAYDEITRKCTKSVKTVGPVPVNSCIILIGIVGYVPTCHMIRIDSIDLVYADNSTETIWCGQLVYEVDDEDYITKLNVLNKIK